MKKKQRMFVVFALLFVFACASAPKLIPESEMNQLGTQSWQELTAKTPALNDPAVTKFVQTVAERVIQASPAAKQHWEVRVFADKQVNAFALPGGYIGVYAGILPIAKNGAGLAAVLGHELTHVLKQHADQRVSEQLISEGILTAASIALGSAQYHDTIMAALGIGSQIGVALPFSRSQEKQADDNGLMLMARAGYDPAQAVDLWQRMLTAEKGQAPPAFLSDHPATKSRIEDLQQLQPEASAIYQKVEPKYGNGGSVPAIPAQFRSG
jgi:predicted Zn-dependent protease